jgi:TonB family protein
MAISVTIAIHVLLTALVIYDWNRPKRATVPDDTIVVTLLPPAPDEPAKREERGVIAAKVPPKPALTELPPPIVELPKQPVIVAAEPAIAPLPVADDGGKSDQLVQTTQAYRQAIMAQLAAERSYPRGPLLAGQQGTGTILFHIDRDGRLLDAAIETTTGRKALDRAALALVRRAAPFPAVPAEMPDRLEISLPIRFLVVEPNTMVAAP